MKLMESSFEFFAGLFFAALFIEASFLPGDILAQTSFYQGKTISLILGTAPGGSSDMMVKSALPYLKKYIPGEPAIVPEYMPGGGGVKAANHIYRNVRPDGLTMGNVGGGLVSNAVLGEAGVLYDIDKLIYLGSPHSHYHWVFMSRREAGLRNLEALRSASGVRVGAQSIGHSVYIVGRLFAYLIGLKEPKFVVGYSGPELDLGLLQGEFDARINKRRHARNSESGMVSQGSYQPSRHYGGPQRAQARSLCEFAGSGTVCKVGQGTKGFGDAARL